MNVALHLTLVPLLPPSGYARWAIEALMIKSVTPTSQPASVLVPATLVGWLVG